MLFSDRRLGSGMDDVSWFTSGELAAMLVDGRRQRDRAEAEWLAWLAEFDIQGGWAIYGCRNCLNWLIQHCGMCRPTAKDKLRVALQLRQRPVLRDALGSGRLSYSKVRALTRIRYMCDEYDEENATKAEELTATVSSGWLGTPKPSKIKTSRRAGWRNAAG